MVIWYLLQGYGCFSGYIMSMYVLYLLQCRRINSVMSSYQVVRNTWNNLGGSAVWCFVNVSCHRDFYIFVPSHLIFYTFCPRPYDKFMYPCAILTLKSIVLPTSHSVYVSSDIRSSEWIQDAGFEAYLSITERNVSWDGEFPAGTGDCCSSEFVSYCITTVYHCL
jgi:hypothetical protein